MHRSIDIPAAACTFSFVQASGPGGQHVNKTATAVELRVQTELLGLPPAVHRRLQHQQRNRINKSGELVIQADQHRSQLSNRKDAMQRLQNMLSQAFVAPKKRVPTKPSGAARRNRLKQKKQRGQLKNSRRKPNLE
ncbi:MAG: alternative ribosome rescue aminoacyl-tRNA hydrolase ArfB [Pseudomonadota bacterium]